MEAVVGLDQLRSDAHLLTGLADTALQHVGNSQLLRYFRQRDRVQLVFVKE